MWYHFSNRVWELTQEEMVHSATDLSPVARSTLGLPMARKYLVQQHILLRVAAPLTEGWRTFVQRAEIHFA